MHASRFIPTARERTYLRAKVRYALRVGKQNAITGSSLARSLIEPDDRKIRAVIRELIHEGVAIASSVGEPAGYYIVANADEAAEYIRVLRERIREDESRLEDFKKAVKDIFIPEQISLL